MRCCGAGHGLSRRWTGGAHRTAGLAAKPGSSCCRGSPTWSRRPTSCSRSSRRRRRRRSRRAVRGAALVADLNAVSPETARGLGVDVDGSISGPPPVAAGTTRIYLSGPRAGEVAALPFDGVEVVVVGDEVGAASAVKMSTASVYKGSVALLTQALRAADHYGVLEHVLSDLGEENARAPDRAVGGEGRPLRRRDARDRRGAGRGGARPGAVRGVRAGVGGDRRDAAGGGRAGGRRVRTSPRPCNSYESASCRKSSMFERPTPTRRSGPGRSASARSSSAQATSPIVAASSRPAASVDERLRIEKSG